MGRPQTFDLEEKKTLTKWQWSGDCLHAKTIVGCDCSRSAPRRLKKLPTIGQASQEPVQPNIAIGRAGTKLLVALGQSPALGSLVVHWALPLQIWGHPSHCWLLDIARIGTIRNMELKNI